MTAPEIVATLGRIASLNAEKVVPAQKVLDEAQAEVRALREAVKQAVDAYTGEPEPPAAA